MQSRGLVEPPCKHVLIVCNGYARLNNQNSAPGHRGVVGAEIRVFPQEGIILFVYANGVFRGRAFAVRSQVVEVQIRDLSQTIAAEGEAVGGVACAAVSEIESLLAVEGVAGVAIGDGLQIRLVM